MGIKAMDVAIEKRSKETKVEYRNLKGSVPADKAEKVSEIGDAYDMSVDEVVEAMADTLIEVYYEKAIAINKKREAEDDASQAAEGGTKRRGRRKKARA